MLTRPIKIYLAAVLIVLIARHSEAQIVFSSPSEYLAVEPGRFGLNGRSTEGPSWTNPDFLDLVEQMNPGIVRYPAGTQANYWDWRTGTFIEGCGKTADFIYSIPMLVSGMPESSEIIYVMNLVRPTPWTNIPLDAPEKVLLSDSVLQLKISDMLEALGEFERLGKFPIALELGNEFNFDSEHAGIYAANPALYLDHTGKIIAAVREHYPALKILLITTKGGTAGRDAWNNPVLEYLDANPDYKAQIYGLVQHHYINDKFGDPTQIHNAESSSEAILEVLDYMDLMDDNYALIPEGMKLCFTEMGATKSNADETWADGLRTALFMLKMAGLGIKVDMVLFHHITRMNVINDAVMKLASSGISVSVISDALKGQDRFGTISISENIPQYNGKPTLHGFQFSNDSSSNLLLINAGRDTLAELDFSFITESDSLNFSKIWHSSSPWETGVYEDGGISVSEFDGRILPFSIILLKFSKTSIDTLWTNKKTTSPIHVYPNPFRDQVNIDLSHEASVIPYGLLSIDGSIVQEGILYPDLNHILIDAPPGYYILRLYLPHNLVSKVVIKLQ